MLKLKSNHQEYCLFSRGWHISDQVGDSGRRQIYDFYKLIKNLKRYNGQKLWGRIISESDFYSLMLGKFHPAKILQKYTSENAWWDDLTDITHEYIGLNYRQLYGEPFLYVQEVIRGFELQKHQERIDAVFLKTNACKWSLIIGLK